MPTEQNEEVTAEPLADGRVIYISRHSRFGTDAVLLAAFAAPRRVDRAVDLCCGGGIIPLLWLGGDAPADVTGVEIQPECCALAERSIAANGDRARFRMIQGDLRRVEEWLPRERYTLVTCNPPYFAVGSGFDSKTQQRRIARSAALHIGHSAADAPADTVPAQRYAAPPQAYCSHLHLPHRYYGSGSIPDRYCHTPWQTLR